EVVAQLGNHQRDIADLDRKKEEVCLRGAARVRHHVQRPQYGCLGAKKRKLFLPGLQTFTILQNNQHAVCMFHRRLLFKYLLRRPRHNCGRTTVFLSTVPIITSTIRSKKSRIVKLWRLKSFVLEIMSLPNKLHDKNAFA